MGNKTTIEKQRRGLPEESGSYDYGYDALGRLGTVARNGENLRTYEYDAFGNRSLLKEGSTETVYAYNSMNQLISRADVMNEETYTYDKRGNLSLIMENGALKNRYTYGAINRLEQAVNGKGDAALYTYNGLGHRSGKTEKGINIQYTIDLTRQYHNLLQKKEEGNIQTFYWDVNVAGMSESREKEPDIFRYYLQDELGSPLRVSGTDTVGRGVNEANVSYLIYGYDEFGNDLYDGLYNDMEDAGIINPYTRQGEKQPFGYTGYQADKISGTYFAQAREYQPKNGRFTAEDVIKGNAAFPDTLNNYGYCWGNPEKLVDLNGLTPENSIYINGVEFKSEPRDGGTIQDVKTTDNYDRALRKQITEEEYQILLDEMEMIGNKRKKYSIYLYNCDTAVVDAISKIDSDFNGYGTEYFKTNMLNMLMLGPKDWAMRNLTPNTSFNSIQERVLGRKSMNRWELVYLGDVDIKEELIKDIDMVILPDGIVKEFIDGINILSSVIGRENKCIE